MKHELRMVGLVLAGSGLLAGCGSTGSTTTTSAAPAASSASVAASTSASASASAASGPVKAKDGKALKIGVSFPILDQFLQKVADGMTARAKEDGVTLNIVSAQEKADVQLSQIENFISDKVDGIVVLPQDTDSTDSITTKVTAAGIPLVYVNRRPATKPDTVPYVGSDSLIAGTLEMEALAKIVGNKGNVAILQGDPAQEAARLRTQGCEDVAKKVGMTVTKTAAGNWQRDKGLSITENWLQSGTQIDVICANNDEMALGAIKALQNANKLSSVKVGGVDATSDALAAMTAGQLAVTVFQDAKGQGAGGIDAVVKLYNKETVPSSIDIPYLLVTPDNMKDFINK